LVAGRNSVRLGFFLTGLNNLKILACDIGIAYLNAPNRERVHVVVGKELLGAEYQGKYAVIDRALYGLKSASAAWRSHLADTIMKILGYLHQSKETQRWECVLLIPLRKLLRYIESKKEA